MTPADFYVETQNSASTTAKSQRERSLPGRAQETTTKCLMTPADFYSKQN